MQLIRTICIAVVIAATGVGAALAQTGSTTGGSLTAALSDLERKIIDEYYRIKGNVLGADPQGQAPGAAQRKATQTMRGPPKNTGTHADDDDDQGKGKGKGRGAAKSKGKSGELPPGLAKRDQLPPGLAKRDKLPPGLQRNPLPSDLLAKLPPAHPGTERVLVGSDLVLLDVATNVVIDIMIGAVLKGP